MADPIDIKIIHNLDEASKEMDDFIAKYNNKTINLNIKPPPEYAAPTPGASQSEKLPFEETSNDRILNRRYQQQTVEKYIPETLKYYKSFNSFSSAIIGGIAGGSGGSGALMRLLGIAGGVAGVSAVTTAVGAVVNNAKSYRERAAEGAGYGLNPYQKAAFGNAFKDVLGEGGEQGILGELLAQKTGGPGQPDLFRGWMAQYRVKTTGKETENELLENYLKAQQNFAKTVDPSMWKTLSENMGQHLDPQNLMRLRDTTPEQLDKAFQDEREQGQEFLDKQQSDNIKKADEERRKAEQRLQKGWDWVTDKTAPFMSDIWKGIKGPPTAEDAAKAPKPGEATPIPWGDWFKGWIGAGSAKADEAPQIPPSAWQQPEQMPYIPIPPELTGKGANLPSEYATPKEFEVGGGGQFVLPGSEKVPENIQDIRDAIVNDKGVLRALTDSDINIGGGGLGVGSAEVGGGGSGTAPTYWSGGMGAAGQSRSLTRGAARGTDAGDISGTAVTQPGEAGKYRPVYNLGDKDLSDPLLSVIAGEAKSGNKAGVDAVIDNMMNRLGTKTYGPSGNLEEVALARGQYTGRRTPNAKEAEFIKSRIKAIASGGLPDITGGSNEYRASWYNGPWRQKHPEGINIGGNVFARNPKGGVSPYAAYPGDDSTVGSRGSAEFTAGAKVDSDFFKSRAGSEVSQTEGLNPEFADDLERAAKAGEAATGQKASFTSLVRSKEKQAELYYNYIHGIGGQGLAAKPGTSLHERGMAADLAEGSTRDWVRAHAGDYGMELVPGDPEHVQLAKSRQAIAGAEAAKAASNKDVIAKADAPRRPEHPSSRNEGQVSQYGKSPTPHLGDVSQFQGDPYIKVHVSNPAGANVVTQVAALGVASGNFQT